jgi:hypothetical protein
MSTHLLVQVHHKHFIKKLLKVVALGNICISSNGGKVIKSGSVGEHVHFIERRSAWPFVSPSSDGGPAETGRLDAGEGRRGPG